MADAHAPPRLTAAHTRRLRAIWHSAGWPCHDVIEAELLVAGLLQRQHDAQGRDTLRVTDAGLAAIAGAVQRHRAARDAHEALVDQVARAQQRNGRLVWRGLSLRAPLQAEDGHTHWQTAMPDVFSIRHTTLEDAVMPVVHEVKVRRADLLSDLRHEAKREAYRALSSQCWYVLRAGIAEPNEVPPVYGVLLAHEGSLEVARPAPHRTMRLPFSTWMALARATPEPALDDAAQPDLPLAASDEASGAEAG